MIKLVIAAVMPLVLIPAYAFAQRAEQTPSVVIQLGPTTPYSTLRCENFAKTPDGSWRAVRRETFGLGFVTNIIPPARPIQIGAWVYNNIDLYSQLEEQCASAPSVRTRY